MMNTTKHKVTFSRETWESLRADEYFREVIEDREAMEKAKKETEYYVDYDEYKKRRAEKSKSKTCTSEELTFA